ncbi:hypothetical protein DLAC_03763 [Tieghemostelium lacteum]|uniref:Uncharacterized protein n=1 Tax=Tieghemostelium lacteum TaxID=361077 RepID=A0A152A159_TIELA|nr:hypothetical protein DLAC_03763 [Tieghemostelium lacteum]|eukprot:KYQ99814.1 hypothetical protein DLAC_03763 [Tieghemostelium lacteum]
MFQLFVNNGKHENHINFIKFFKSNESVKNIIVSSFVIDWYWFTKQIYKIRKSNKTVIDDIQIAVHYDIDSGITEQPLNSTDTIKIISIDQYQNINGKEKQYRNLLVGYENTNFQYTLIHPILSRIGILHSKIIIIQFESFIRIVISSSNLTKSDWKNLSQNVFIIDLFETKQDTLNTITNHHIFQNELTLTLDSLGFYSPNNKFQHINTFLQNYDFTVLHNNNIHIVTSIPGNHKNSQLFGILKLNYLLNNQNNDIKNNNSLIYQTSAIGNLNLKWYSDFLKYILIDGDNTMVKVLFPTKESVYQLANDNPIYGLESITIRYLDKLNLLIQNQSLYDISYRNTNGQPLHSKIILFQNSSNSWIYHGSHNLTESSWGVVSKNTIQIHNYETGVWFPYTLFSQYQQDPLFKFNIDQCQLNNNPWKFKNEIPFLKGIYNSLDQHFNNDQDIYHFKEFYKENKNQFN